jgi:hypothetical protein
MALVQILLFVHVTAVVAWIGGVIMHLALMGLARGNHETRVKLLELDGKLAPIVYIPGSLLVVITGVVMILLGVASWSDPFIDVGLAVWVISFGIGATFYGPQGKKLGQAIEAGGPSSPEAQAIITRMEAVTWAQLPLLLLAIFAMTTRLSF